MEKLGAILCADAKRISSDAQELIQAKLLERVNRSTGLETKRVAQALRTHIILNAPTTIQLENGLASLRSAVYLDGNASDTY